jgi:hypothetical protein
MAKQEVEKLLVRPNVKANQLWVDIHNNFFRKKLVVTMELSVIETYDGK